MFRVREEWENYSIYKSQKPPISFESHISGKSTAGYILRPNACLVYFSTALKSITLRHECIPRQIGEKLERIEHTYEW